MKIALLVAGMCLAGALPAQDTSVSDAHVAEARKLLRLVNPKMDEQSESFKRRLGSVARGLKMLSFPEPQRRVELLKQGRYAATINDAPGVWTEGLSLAAGYKYLDQLVANREAISLPEPLTVDKLISWLMHAIQMSEFEMFERASLYAILKNIPIPEGVEEAFRTLPEFVRAGGNQMYADAVAKFTANASIDVVLSMIVASDYARGAASILELGLKRQAAEAARQRQAP